MRARGLFGHRLVYNLNGIWQRMSKPPRCQPSAFSSHRNTSYEQTTFQESIDEKNIATTERIRMNDEVQSTSQGVHPNDQNKLLQLTAQCINYYNRYCTEKETHLRLISKAFDLLQTKIDKAYNQLIEDCQHRKQEIRDYLVQEQQKLTNIKEIQQEGLSNHLAIIKEKHLSQFLKQESTQLFKQELNQFPDHDQREMTCYAKTLESFFTVMTEIQQEHFEDNLEECISFINNLAREELQRLIQQHPLDLDQLLPAKSSRQLSFTFEQNCNQLDIPDSFIEHFQQQASQKLAKSLADIKRKQSRRKQHLDQYAGLLRGSSMK